MNGVEVPVKRKFNLSLGRVELNQGFLSLGRGRENQCGESREYREEERKGGSTRGMDFANHIC